MRLTKKFWIGSLIAASMMLAAVSSGQPSPTLKANNARTGVNANPGTSSPGRAFLTWFRPNLNDALAGTIVRNNTAAAPNVAFTPGFVPAPATGIAAFHYDQPSFGDQAADMATGGFANYPLVFDGRTPEYRYATTVQAGSIDDPRVGSTQTFTWSMDPLAAPINQPGTGPNFARNYALYVWLPIGSTVSGLGRQFPQRYYVYEIQYGPDPEDVYIEVIDTYAAGAGWVRLGNAGNDSNRMFHYNGTYPIQIRLHNTVPLNSAGFPTDTVGATLVYADAAMAVPQSGVMNATPTVSALPTVVPGVSEGRAVAAVNRLSLGQREGQTVTVSQGEVKSYNYADGSFDSAFTGTRWTFRPADQVFTITMDNLVASNSGFASNPVGPGSAAALGTDYLTAPLVPTPGPATAAVTYAPTLEEGLYQIQMYLAPDTVGQQFGQAVDVEVHEGTTVTTLTINMNRGPGWYPVGNTRYQHTELENLRFVVTNVGSAADVTDGRLAYADAVRFVGAFDVEVNSTPTSARVFITPQGGGVPVEQEVVIVCADDGRIYCLDAYGNADGTTNVYWAYPSIPDPNNASWTDPNIDEGIDGNGGVTIAEMPIGFGRSSPVVQRVGGQDYVFIAARNGRVYSINTAGRGDYDFTTQRPGTARRQWSYPNDYPRTRQAGSLGSFTNASLAYAEVGGTPRLYVPTESGHMLALNPVGDVANRITNVLWDFPGRTAQLAPVSTTPAIFNGRVYFGTTLDSAGAGHFYSVDAATGSTATAQEFIPAPILGDPDPPALGAFFGGPAAVTAADIGGVGAVDTIYVANNNLNVYALEAANIQNVIWRTNELNTTVTGPLTFTIMSVFDTSQAPGSYPVVVVPGDNGQWSALFARGGLIGNGVLNSFGGKFAWGKISQGNILAGTSVGNPLGQPGFLYGGDTNGNLFAFSNSNTLPGQGDPPITDIIEPDNPLGDAWRNAKIKILPNRTMYDDLRTDPTSIDHGTIDGLLQNPPYAFEWGETVYFIVYDFPYSETLTGGPMISPALVNVQISTEGAASRQFSIVARQFPGTTPPQRDGYAVLAFAVQGSGPNSLPPGRGRVTYTVTPARSSAQQASQVAQNQNSYLDFQVANPIGIAVGAGLNEQIGVTAVTNDPGALVNGTPNLASTPANNESLLTTFFGVVGHATTGGAVVQVYDRSLMTFLRGEGRGVDQVRVGRQDLEWLGGSAAIIKPIPTGIFGTLFEDLPDDRPNVSLDYPNIKAESLRATKDPNGQAENPVYSGVFLRPPTNPDGTPLTEANTPSARRLVPTPFLFEVDVPRFQPANFGQAWTSSTGANIPSGYSGRVSVFVDSNNDGYLNTISGRLEANRGFWLNGSVSIDEAIEVRTPTVDLGSLPGGAGYSPLIPGTGGPFNPWTGSPELISMFKSFVVENPGNVNLLNLRLAKATNNPNTGERLSWGIFSSSVDELAWVDAGVGLWSDIDSIFARTPQVIAQKPRVGDRSAAVLQTNPNIRPNGNLDTAGGRFLAAPFSDNPRVAVTLPIGFPVGTYSQVMRIIEDANGDESLALIGNSAQEAFSDPTFNLILKVRETRLTNNHTRLTAPMVDESAVLGSDSAAFLHQNLQPTAARVSAGSDIGQLLVAWTSSRPTDVAVQPTNASGNDRFRIFLAGLGSNNAQPIGHPNLIIDPNNPTQDLLGFENSTVNKWFSASPDSANGYPGGGYVFPTIAGETVVPGTDKYGAPALPSRGQVNTVAGVVSQPTQFGNFDMPFIGEAQKHTPSGRVSESRLFITRVTMDGNGVPSIEPTPFDMPFDIYSQKGRPTAVRIGDLLGGSPEDLTFVAYSALSAGNSRIYWTMFDYLSRNDADTHGWSRPQPINFGDGFESVASPSVTVRPYVGQGGHGSAIYDISFTGKLRGRRNSEVFQGRLSFADPSNPVANPSNPVDYPRIVEEVLTPDAETGLFRARGVDWNLQLPTPPQPVVLGLQNAAGVTVNIEVPNTRAFDQATGLVTFNTTLGGKAYLDPRMGTVRLSSGLPLSTQQLVLTYTPKFLRVSTGTTAGYSGVSQFHDSRFDGVSGQNTRYWARPNGSGINGTDTPRVHRFFLNYNRAAAGAGQAARPFMKTMRLGVRLPHQLHTDQNGNITGLTVTGATDYFQVDPVKGRIYFSPSDEDRVVTITYSAMDQSTGAPLPGFTFTGPVTLVSEMDETPVPIEQAVNESNLYAFPDPFDSPTFRRPNLVWMFWSSTRGGSPDLYFQTIAPRFAPQPSGN